MSGYTADSLTGNSDYQARIVDLCKRKFAQKQTMRTVFAQHWEEVAELVLPTSRNTFYYGSYNFPGQKKTDRQVDSSAALALDRFAAILDSLLTPRNMMWHGLEATDPYLMKDRATRMWFEQATRLLFKYRYAPIGNFSAQNQNQYVGLGAFGTASLFVDKYEGPDGAVGLRYKHLPLGETFLSENHQGLIDELQRWFRLTPQQACKMFPDTCPEQIRSAAAQGSEMPFEFLHTICPRDDYDPDQILTYKGMIYGSYYICLSTSSFLREGGYRSFPVPTSRYIQTPGEVYGRSPMMQALPAIKTLNSEKRDFLTQGHRSAAPPLLTREDGLTDFSFRADALNKGGVSEDGKPLVVPLPTGNINITKEMMDEERAIIDGVSLVDLFKVLLGDPKIYTATQITEMVAQRGVLIAPVVGRQQSEYLGPLIERELDVLADLQINGRPVLPPMPPLLREARGDYQVTYSSPLARDMRAQEVAGAMRTIDMAIQVANASGDPSVFDRFDFDAIMKDAAAIQGMPESWVRADDAMATIRKARAQQQEREMRAREAPAEAALAKAGAAQAKAGITPGQLGPLTGPVQAPQRLAA